MFTEDYVQAVVEGADLSATVDALLLEAEVPVPNPGNPAKPIAPGRPQVRNPSLIRKALPYAVGAGLVARQVLGKNTYGKQLANYGAGKVAELAAAQINAQQRTPHPMPANS